MVTPPCRSARSCRARLLDASQTDESALGRTPVMRTAVLFWLLTITETN